MDTGQIGRALIIAGIAIAAFGLFLTVGGRLSWLGRLPGDIVVQRKGFTLYFPVTTSILVSLILSALFWLIGRK